MTIWEAITESLQKAFKDSEAPYIDDICRLSKSGRAAANISWWVQGIWEILEELINSGYVKPETENIDHLYNAIALLENYENERSQS